MKPGRANHEAGAGREEALVSEFLILPDGRVYVQNLTEPMAELLSQLNPDDPTIQRACPAPALSSIMNFQSELELLVRARYPIIYIISSEETRGAKPGGGGGDEAQEEGV